MADTETPLKLWRPEKLSARERAVRSVREGAPLFLRPLLREVKARFRPDPEIPALAAEVSSLQQQWRRILDATAAGATADRTSPHVMFFTGFGLGTAFATREAILIKALQRRGCRVSSLYCDVTLPACEFNAAGSHMPAPGPLANGLTDEVRLATCRRCASNVRSTFDTLGVESFTYHEFLAQDVYDAAAAAVRDVSFEDFRNFEYEGIAVGEEVFASVLRVTFKGTVEDTPFNRKLVHRYLISGVVMCRSAEAAYIALRPDRIMMPHGVYVTHGIAAKVARRMGVPFIVYGGGVRKDTLILSPNETYHRSLVNEPNDIWEAPELTAEQRTRTWDYALSKQSGGVDALNYHPTPLEDAQLLYRELSIDTSRPIVSFFTNVIWDAQIYYDGQAFENILDWMRFSIERIAQNDKVWGIVRIHPAEVKGGVPSLQPFLPEIRKWFPTLPPNVRVIPPESNISSYTLAELSRAVVIYGTKMGLEVAVRGVPVVICGQTFTRNKGFTIDISSKKQYERLLNRIEEVERMPHDKVERALRYAHYLYFRRMVDFPYLTLSDYKHLKGKRIALSSLDELDVGRDPYLDMICKAIIDGTPPYLDAAVHAL